MRFIQTFADSWVIGVSYAADFLADDQEDVICLASANETPSVVTFHKKEEVSLRYNGEPVESLELAPKALFIGAVKNGNITPLVGELTPAPAYPVQENEFYQISDSVALTTSIPEGFKKQVYRAEQRRQLKRINEAMGEARKAKKISEDIF